MCVRVFSAGLDSMSPARSRRSASHAAGTHGWLPQKTGRSGLRRGGVGGYNLHSVPPDCGTPTTSRLYPFGASKQNNLIYQKSCIVQHIVTHLLYCLKIDICLICLLLFNTLNTSDAPVGMSWQLPDYSIFDLFVCFLVPNYVFSTI